MSIITVQFMVSIKFISFNSFNFKFPAAKLTEPLKQLARKNKNLGKNDQRNSIAMFYLNHLGSIGKGAN